MESDTIRPSGILECECGRSCCNNRSCTQTWIRSVKRKLDELEEERYKFVIPGLSIPEVARVEIKNECCALREMVTNQKQTIRDLSVELEEERNASSSAANEAMSMILRLQQEKAEIEMEARQFKRFAAEKTSHDQKEIIALEELLYKREQTIQSLTCEVQAYKYRMMSYGLTESEAEGEKGAITHTHSIVTNSESHFSQSSPFGQFDFIPYDYPPLKCHPNEQQIYPESESENIDIEKYPFSETPCSLKDIEQRINELERSPRQQPVLEKVVVGHAPRTQQLTSRFSLDSGSSIFATIKEDNSSVKKVDSASEYESEMSDRIYTVDSIHYGASYQNDPKANVNTNDDFMNSPKDSMHHSHNDVQDPEVLKLYARLHALEADRESMRQAIINMRTDKAQLVLLKEIAQNLCKGMSPASRMPVKKQSVFWTFGHSVASFMLWRRKANHTKYMLGMTASDAGLLVLLGKGSQMGQWRCVSRTQL